MRRPVAAVQIDVADRPKTEPVVLPRRGPLGVRYVTETGRLSCSPYVSRGLAETLLRMAGYNVVTE